MDNVNKAYDLFNTMAYSLDNKDLEHYLGNPRIMSDRDLQKYKSIDEIFNMNSPDREYVIILFLNNDKNGEQEGHWTVLSKYMKDEKDPFIEFYDSYGNSPDGVYNFISDDEAKKMGIKKGYLTKLLKNSKAKTIYNKRSYQETSDRINTCGRHVLLRVLNMLGNDQSLIDYNNMMKDVKEGSGLPYDQIVSKLISIH